MLVDVRLLSKMSKQQTAMASLRMTELNHSELHQSDFGKIIIIIYLL